MEYLAVASGGFLGAVSRDLLGRLFGGGYLPYGTLAANLAGAFLLLFLMTIFLELLPLGRPALRLGLATGFLGSFTTFSTLSRELFELLEKEPVVFFAYALVSLAGGLLLGLGGRFLALYLVNLYVKKAPAGEDG